MVDRGSRLETVERPELVQETGAASRRYFFGEDQAMLAIGAAAHAEPHPEISLDVSWLSVLRPVAHGN
jgi:hypothetical protein